MTSISCSFVQGAVAGGSAAYLQTRTKKEVNQNSNEKWMGVALQVNHLLLLSAETIRFAGAPLGAFGTVVKVACALTPVALGVGLYNKEAIPFTDKRVDQWNTVYKTGVVVASLATLALGNPAFAVASLGMLAIDTYVEGKGKEVFEVVKKVAAACALIGYGAQAYAADGLLAGINAINAFVVGGKQIVSMERPNVSYDDIRDKDAFSDNDSDDSWHNRKDYIGQRDSDRYAPNYRPELPQNSGVSEALSHLCRPSVWA